VGGSRGHRSDERATKKTNTLKSFQPCRHRKPARGSLQKKGEIKRNQKKKRNRGGGKYSGLKREEPTSGLISGRDAQRRRLRNLQREKKKKDWEINSSIREKTRSDGYAKGSVEKNGPSQKQKRGRS